MYIFHRITAGADCILFVLGIFTIDVDINKILFQSMSVELMQNDNKHINQFYIYFLSSQPILISGSAVLATGRRD